MLHEFLKTNRSELIERCRRKVATRRTPRATPAELQHGVPLFLDQFTDMLAAAPPARRAASADVQLAEGATRHGDELRRHAFTIDQVVHDYGDLCQSITELAGEQGAPITVQEFGILNIRLDNAIASAVLEFTRTPPPPAETVEVPPATGERLGELAHEMRNFLNTTILAITAIKMGSVGFGGVTAGALDRSLIGMRTLIDRTLAEVRLDGGTPLREVIEIGQFIAEVRVAAALEAAQKGCALSVFAIEPGLFVQADRHILASAVSNLLQNAFKFTRANSHVTLQARAVGGRVLIEVEDECGGLPPGAEQTIFRPFEQRGANRTGVGLGLSLSRHGIQSIGGVLSVRSNPGRGCVFTIDVPQMSPPG